MNKEMIKERLRLLREKMQQYGIDYYLIPTADFHNSEYVDDYFKVREYFSDFTGSNGSLVVGRKETGLWTDGRYFIQAQKELEGTGILLFRMAEEGVLTIPEYLETEMKEGETLGFDGRVVDCEFGRRLSERLKKKNISIRYEQDLAEEIWKDRPPLPCNEIKILQKEVCGLSYEEKAEYVRKEMKAKNASYLLLGKLDDLMWLLNIRGSDVTCNPVALSYGFLTMEGMYFFVQKEAVTKEFEEYCRKNNIIIKDYHEITGFLRTYPFEGTVLYDGSNLNYALYRVVEQKARLQEASNPTALLKAVKNETEIKNMQKVYLKDNVVVTKFIYWLKQNVGSLPMNEYTVGRKLDEMRSQIPEFLDLSFETIAGYKENAAMMHYEATEENNRIIEPEGMLLVDSGGQYLGGTTDITRTIVLGEISEEMKQHFSAVAAGMLRLTNAHFLSGCTGRNLDILARGPLWDLNIDYKCGTGHGIGYILNVHEGPQNIRWRYAEGQREAVLEEGMVVTNEPGVYREGSHGIRTENVLLVRKGKKNADGQFMHFETLTYVPIDREALDKKYLTEREVQWINEYHEEVYTRLAEYMTEEERVWLREATMPL